MGSGCERVSLGGMFQVSPATALNPVQGACELEIEICSTRIDAAGGACSARPLGAGASVAAAAAPAPARRPWPQIKPGYSQEARYATKHAVSWGQTATKASENKVRRAAVTAPLARSRGTHAKNMVDDRLAWICIISTRPLSPETELAVSSCSSSARARKAARWA